ncbi:MAG: UDP-3-O-acyl-N-acetylglucosamine deacetylase [Lacunisphaera sp.]
MLKLGKIKGGSLDSAIVIKGDKIISKEPLRFADEFVRHKILDIIGDIVLLGVPLKAHIVATRPGPRAQRRADQGALREIRRLEKGRQEGRQARARQGRDHDRDDPRYPPRARHAARTATRSSCSTASSR